MEIILSTSYLAPIQYYSKFIKYNKVLIERYENYIKQTYRNRCIIYSANGLVNLTIPVKKDKTKTYIKDITIDYDTNWRKLHWKSIESSYRSSPFFEFFEDDLFPFYTKKFKYLIDYNTELQNLMLDNIGIENIQFNYTNEYYKGSDILDYREVFHPKKSMAKEDKYYKPEKYHQVFNNKHGWKANLSIIDLLFNEGPNAINILEQSIINFKTQAK
ncbi:MAG: WbqC family protein [Bacteroidota bacterium]|nr:WbqC family protein [Bacteroidota bacterium]